MPSRKPIKVKKAGTRKKQNDSIRYSRPVKKSNRVTNSKILLRKALVADGQPNLDTVPQSALNLLAQGMTSVAFKLSFDSGSIILKRSRIRNPDDELGHTDTALKRELAFYKMIDSLPVLEQQFLARCYDWRIYDQCFFAGRGLMAAEPLKPAAEPGVCLDMLLEYKGPSLADWLNSRYLEKPNARSSGKSGMLGGSVLGSSVGGGGPRYKPKEPYRLLYSIFWQLAIIFKILGKHGWHHVDAHPHNITVVNGLTLEGGRRIDYSPLKVTVPTDLLPTEIVYRLEQPPAPNIIPVSSLVPTQGIQIALIDYNLVRHKDFPKAEWMFAPLGTRLDGAEGEVALNMELKRRILALVFGEHKMMAEVRRRNMPLRNFRLIVDTNTNMARKYPEEWNEWVTRLSNDPQRVLLGYPEYLTTIRRKINYAHDDIEESKFVFRMLYMRIECELFWLWQLSHPAEICQEYGFDTVYQPLLPRDRVLELFFGENTRTPDDIIIWCCEKLGVRPIVNKRLTQSQKNGPE